MMPLDDSEFIKEEMYSEILCMGPHKPAGEDCHQSLCLCYLCINKWLKREIFLRNRKKLSNTGN